jgi:hypothetical protein
VLKVLVKLYTDSGTVSDYVSVCTCLMFLEDHSAVAKILDQLLMGSDDDVLIAYQVPPSLHLCAYHLPYTTQPQHPN